MIAVANIKKENPGREAEPQAGESLRIAVFPGGERLLERIVSLLESGGLKVARSARTPLVPVVGKDGGAATFVLEVSDESLGAAPEAPRREPLSLADAEAVHIRRVLEICNGNRTRAAVALGVARSTLIRKLQEVEVREKHR